MSAHTPGPWIVSARRILPKEGAYPDGVAHIMDIPGWNAHAEEQANARLIAAAPELLEALKVAAKYVHVEGDTDECLQVEAAIAKAGGK